MTDHKAAMIRQTRAQNEALKPCPFCGGEARLEVAYTEYNDQFVVIGCSACPASMDDGREEAVAAWNNRHNEGVEQ